MSLRALLEGPLVRHFAPTGGDQNGVARHSQARHLFFPVLGIVPRQHVIEMVEEKELRPFLRREVKLAPPVRDRLEIARLVTRRRLGTRRGEVAPEGRLPQTTIA